MKYRSQSDPQLCCGKVVMEGYPRTLLRDILSNALSPSESPKQSPWSEILSQLKSHAILKVTFGGESAAASAIHQ